MTSSRNSLALLLAAGLALASGCLHRRVPAPALPPSPAVGEVPALTVPYTATAPVIDGMLDDPAWAAAATIDGLQPALGLAPAPGATAVRVLWDEQYLYVGFVCTDAEVFAREGHRHDDLLYKEDVCEVFLDGFGDGRQFVEIQVNPYGVNMDMMYLFTREAAYTPELRLLPEICARDRWGFLEWNLEGLRTAARKTATGWTAEFAIPAPVIMKRKGCNTFCPTELRAHFMRYDWIARPGSAERDLHQQNWSAVLLGNPHNSPGRMGRLNLVK